MLPDVQRPRLLVRREDGRIGVRRSPGRVDVPGFLFSHGASGLAKFDAQGRFGAVATPAQPARLDKLRVERGTWRYEVSATSEVVVVVSPRPSCGARPKPQPPAFEICAAEGKVSFSVTPKSEGETRVLAATLIRVDP
jgi:hypothetical protein